MKWNYNTWRISHISCSWFSSGSSIHAKFEFGNGHFCGEGKIRELKEGNPRTNLPWNQQHPQPAHNVFRLEPNLGHIDERQVLSLLCHSCSPGMSAVIKLVMSSWKGMPKMSKFSKWTVKWMVLTVNNEKDSRNVCLAGPKVLVS